jgi:hypothetical protein
MKNVFLVWFTASILSTFALGGESLIDKDSLAPDSKIWRAWGVKPEALRGGTSGTPSTKLTFPDAGGMGGLVSTQIPVAEGTKILLTFKVRGQGALQGHFFQYGTEKKPAVKEMQPLGVLGDEWKAIARTLMISNGSTSLTLNFLFYKTAGWFELCDVTLEPQSAGGKAAKAPNPRRLGASGPVGAWTFEEGDADGSTVYDRAGNASGDLTAGSVFAQGRHGRAVRFDGINGRFVGDDAPALGQNFTLAAWFKTAHLGETALSVEGQHSLYAGDVRGCPLFRINKDGKLCLVRCDIAVVASSREAVKVDTWTHVAVSYAESGRCTFYIDGNPAGESSVAHQAFEAAERLSLGQADAGGPKRAMKGELDEVRAYDRVLGADEVADLAQAPALAGAPSGEKAARRKGTLALHLQSRAEFNWFSFGKPVVFVAEGGVVPAAITRLTGRAWDTSGKKVGEASVTRAELLSGGWAWSPAQPGFYEVSFTFTADGKEIPIVWAYNLQTTRGTTKKFERERQSIAVMAPRAGKRPAQFGVCQDDADEAILRIGADIGFSFARLWVTWGDHWDPTLIVNPARGVFQWKHLDRDLALVERLGYRDNFMTLFGTPAWASPFPERKEVDICVRRFAAFAPKDMGDWTAFVEAISGRYGKRIPTWEIWNEPHLPTGSVFWRDTTAKYAELVKTGYETLKRVQPGATVMLGGQGGKRYFPFYREFLKVGGAPFDFLTMHGSWPAVGGFREMEKEFKVPSKPWMSTEWHAVLLNASDRSATEAELARRMVLDLCEQFQNGAERVALFTMSEGHGEKELLPLAIGDGSFQQSFGLFRKNPWREPRLCAAVLRTFIDQVENRLVWRGVADLSGGQRVLWFEDSGKTVAVVWSLSKSAAPLDARLGMNLGGAKVTSWEGAPLTITDGFTMDETRMLFIRGLPSEVLKALAPSTVALNPALLLQKAAIGPVPTGSWNRERVVDSDLRASGDLDRMAWNEKDWVWKGIASDSIPVGFKARYALSMSAKGLDLIAEVDDKDHVSIDKGGEYWNGDSLQFALDLEGKGENGMQSEFVVSGQKGPATLVKTLAGNIGGDIPQGWTPAGKVVVNGKASVAREGARTVYRVHLDGTELYPFAFDASSTKLLRFSVLVNNNNGKGRAGYLEWSSGIGGEKNPAAFGKVELR